MFENFKEIIKQWQKKSKQKSLCAQYRNKDASNGGCMGFSWNWTDTHSMCKKCKKYFENK